MKATHKGHCQVCGHLQMLPSGKLSKHGYQVKWSAFVGTCWGADNLPFEQSKALIDGAIKRAEERRNEINATIKALRSIEAPQTMWVNEYVGAESRAAYLRGDTYRWREIKRADAQLDGRELTWPQMPGSKSREVGGRARTTIYELADRTLDRAMYLQNERRATFLTKQVENLAQYIEWQRGRIAGWKVQPLIER